MLLQLCNVTHFFSLALLPTHFMLNIWGHNVWSWESTVTPHSWTHQTLPNWIQTLHKHMCTHTQTYMCVCSLFRWEQIWHLVVLEHFFIFKLLFSVCCCEYFTCILGFSSGNIARNVSNQKSNQSSLALKVSGNYNSNVGFSG